MSHLLFTSAAGTIFRNMAIQPMDPEDHRAAQVLESLGQVGLGTRVNPNGTVHPQSDVDDAFGAISGAETASNLNTLGHWFSYLNTAVDQLNAALFKEKMVPYVQHDNRSVVAAFSRRGGESVNGMLELMMQFVHKDIKHPVRTLLHINGNDNTIASADYNHFMDDELVYTEAETGTYHTLLSTAHPADRVRTYSVYLEDTPLVRRYLRYIDSMALRHGVRLVYCPKTFDHLEEIAAATKPTWSVVDDRVIRQHRGTRYRALVVSLAFVYDAFSPLTRVETEVQPNQRAREAQSMNYTPVVTEYLDTFVHVLKQLGAFSVCKIYYKGSRTPARS